MAVKALDYSVQDNIVDPDDGLVFCHFTWLFLLFSQTLCWHHSPDAPIECLWPTQKKGSSALFTPSKHLAHIFRLSSVPITKCWAVKI